MAIKVLVGLAGNQLIADTKQIENKETGEVVAYWVKNPQTLNYTQNEDGTVGLGFGSYCLVSDENEFSIKEPAIVAILEPKAEVVEAYNKKINPPEVDDETSTPDTKNGTDTDSTDE